MPIVGGIVLSHRTNTEPLISGEAVPTISKAQVMALTTGDGCLEKGGNLLLFLSPGGGKSHLEQRLTWRSSKNRRRVLFTRITDLNHRRRVSGLPRNNHGFADRTARYPRRVGDSHLCVPECGPCRTRVVPSTAASPEAA